MTRPSFTHPPSVHRFNGKICVSSRDVAKSFRKAHNHILTSIRQLPIPDDFRADHIFPTTYTSPRNFKVYPAFELDEDGFIMLAGRFGGQAAAEMKIRYLRAFDAEEVFGGDLPPFEEVFPEYAAKASSFSDPEIPDRSSPQDETPNYSETPNGSIVPFHFEGHEIRVVTDEQGNPWWVGKDVAVALGYKDPTNAMKQHCKGVAKRHPLQTLGGNQEVRIIHEGDVMRLIVSSKLPSAVKFERWLFDEVLPTIRRTGRYEMPGAHRQAAPPSQLTPEQLAQIVSQTVAQTMVAMGVANPGKKPDLDYPLETARPADGSGKVTYYNTVADPKWGAPLWKALDILEAAGHNVYGLRAHLRIIEFFTFKNCERKKQTVPHVHLEWEKDFMNTNPITMEKFPRRLKRGDLILQIESCTPHAFDGSKPILRGVMP